MEKIYTNRVLEQIIEMFRLNLIMQYHENGDYFLNIRKYCKENKNKRNVPYEELVCLTEEALEDLIKSDFFYNIWELIDC